MFYKRSAQHVKFTIMQLKKLGKFLPLSPGKWNSDSEGCPELVHWFSLLIYPLCSQIQPLTYYEFWVLYFSILEVYFFLKVHFFLKCALSLCVVFYSLYIFSCLPFLSTWSKQLFFFNLGLIILVSEICMGLFLWSVISDSSCLC